MNVTTVFRANAAFSLRPVCTPSSRSIRVLRAPGVNADSLISPRNRSRSHRRVARYKQGILTSISMTNVTAISFRLRIYITLSFTSPTPPPPFQCRLVPEPRCLHRRHPGDRLVFVMAPDQWNRSGPVIPRMVGSPDVQSRPLQRIHQLYLDTRSNLVSLFLLAQWLLDGAVYIHPQVPRSHSPYLALSAARRAFLVPSVGLF